MSKISFLESLPICVDLDGTLVRQDTTYILWKKLQRQSLLQAMGLVCGGSILRGRAALKAALASRVQWDPAQLPYHPVLLSWLCFLASQNKKLVLATGADQAVARSVAHHLGFFHTIVASDGVHNCTKNIKAHLLCQHFGAGKFIYVGNAWQDVPVWKQAAGIVAVQVRPSLSAWLKKTWPQKICFVLP